jgi:hypothetical protein
MGTEAFAELASVLCPGFHVASVEDESFLLPFKFHRNLPATLHLSAVGAPGAPGEIVVSTELRSILQPKPEFPAQERVHFRARVRMRREKPDAPSVAFKKPAARALSTGAEAVYSVYFHGPAYRVIDRAAVDGKGVVAAMSAALPPNAKPANAEQVLAPRLIELCFQAAGLWLLENKQTMGLPTALERATAYRPEGGDKRLFAVVEAREGGGAFDVRVVDEKGLVHAEVAGYRTVALPGRTTLPR